MDTDRETRCAHYHGPLDRVAIRFRCCQRYYCCHACHEECESHEAVPWPPEEFDLAAVLCGACGQELTIYEYLASGSRCPRCDAGFNPRCAAHYPRYFQVGGAGESLELPPQSGQ
ncbi:MAG TPA: CHY zinc finger protein [Gemmatimonadales bacterium]|nr:CHY zinc finger protein [Gemmatimonadales bacterium]